MDRLIQNALSKVRSAAQGLFNKTTLDESISNTFKFNVQPKLQKAYKAPIIPIASLIPQTQLFSSISPKLSHQNIVNTAMDFTFRPLAQTGAKAALDIANKNPMFFKQSYMNYKPQGSFEKFMLESEPITPFTSDINKTSQWLNKPTVLNKNLPFSFGQENANLLAPLAVGGVAASNLLPFGIGKSTKLTKASKYLNQVADAESIKKIMRFADWVDRTGGKGDPIKAGLEPELLPEVQAIARDMFGDAATTVNNTQLKNAFDTVLNEIGRKQNRFNLGLEVRNTRGGESIEEVAEKLYGQRSLRTSGKNQFSNVREYDNPLLRGQDWQNAEPLPWEAKDLKPSFPIPDYADDMKNAGNYVNSGIRGRINPLNNLSPDLKKAFVDHNNELKKAQVTGNKVAYEIGGIKDPDLEFRLVKYSQDPTEITKEIEGLTDADLAKGAGIIAKHKAFNEDIYKRANDAGIDTNYLKNHIFQAWKETPEEVEKVLKARGLGQRPGFTNQRRIRTFAQGEAYGLTPKYTTFAQLNALAEHELQKAIANKKLFEKLKASGQIQPAETENLPLDWKVIEAPFFPKQITKTADGLTLSSVYKAPPELAAVVNNIFGEESKSIVSTALRLGQKVSGTMQDLALSGGVGPLNFFGLGQLIKEMTSGRVSRPMAAFFRAYVPGASKEFEIKNANYIEEMASKGIASRGVANYEKLYRNIRENKGLRDVLGEGWYKVVNEPTFAKFLNQLQIEFYKDTRAALLKKGMKPEEAIDIAAKATKKFYGTSDPLGRSREFDNAIGTIFLAPKYRESLINVYGSILKGFDPRTLGQEEYKGIHRLMVGMALSYGAYDYTQHKLTGKHMWENPPGKEFEIVIPIGDPKDNKYISVPMMPGFTALARRGAGTVAALAKGEPKEAGKQFSSLFSIPVSKGGELLANSDYFGQPIYGEDTTPLQTAAYGVGSFAPGYGRALMNVATGKSTPAFGIVQALELPVRVGSFPNKYYTAKEEIEKGITRDQMPLWQTLNTSKKNGGLGAEARAELLLNNPWALEKYTQLQLASDENNPLYSRSEDDIKAYLVYQMLEDSQRKAQIRSLYPWIPSVQYALSKNISESINSKNVPTPGYDPNTIQGKLGSAFIPQKKVDTSNSFEVGSPSPMQAMTPEMVEVASIYSGLTKGSPQRKALLANNPWLKLYWEENEKYYANNPFELSGPTADFLASKGLPTASQQASTGTSGGFLPRVKKIKFKKVKKVKLSNSKLTKLKKVKGLKKSKVKKIKPLKIKKLKYTV